MKNHKCRWFGTEKAGVVKCIICGDLKDLRSKEFKRLSEKCEKKLMNDLQLILSSEKIKAVRYIDGERYIELK
jgi:hypothetical protein